MILRGRNLKPGESLAFAKAKTGKAMTLLNEKRFHADKTYRLVISKQKAHGRVLINRKKQYSLSRSVHKKSGIIVMTTKVAQVQMLRTHHNKLVHMRLFHDLRKNGFIQTLAKICAFYRAIISPNLSENT